MPFALAVRVKSETGQPKASITAWQASTCLQQLSYTGILFVWEKPSINENGLDYPHLQSIWRTRLRSDGLISCSQANIDGRKSAKCPLA